MYSQEDALKISSYYEGKAEWLHAAENYEKANNPTKALQLYQKYADSS